MRHPLVQGKLTVLGLLAGALITAGPGAVAAHADCSSDQTGSSPDQTATSGASYPAKLEVLRAGVQGGRLDVLAKISRRADDDEVRVDFIANGKRFSFTERVREGRIRFKRSLPRAQRRMSSGIIEMRYAGSERVRPTEARLRAAKRRALLKRDLLSLNDGVLTARGSLTDRAKGVVRLILGFERPDGSSGQWEGRAPIGRDGRWRLEEELPADARQGGYLSVQFTGYHARRIRGEQIAKQVLDGQIFR